MKSFGSTPQGARLERIKASPRWAGERFRNVTDGFGRSDSRRALRRFFGVESSGPLSATKA